MTFILLVLTLCVLPSHLAHTDLTDEANNLHC